MANGNRVGIWSLPIDREKDNTFVGAPWLAIRIKNIWQKEENTQILLVGQKTKIKALNKTRTNRKLNYYDNTNGKKKPKIRA
jgi:hypothetical protein